MFNYSNLKTDAPNITYAVTFVILVALVVSVFYFARSTVTPPDTSIQDSFSKITTDIKNLHTLTGAFIKEKTRLCNEIGVNANKLISNGLFPTVSKDILEIDCSQNQ